jgi:hypothetical protein
MTIRYESPAKCVNQSYVAQHEEVLPYDISI